MSIELPSNYPTEIIKDIAVNQIAYGIDDDKVAVIKEFGGKMYLVDEKTGKAVFEADAKGPIFDNTNEINVYHFDFSSVKEKGEYYVATEKGRSYGFEINAKPIHDVSYALLKMLYYQRCSCGLDEKYAGKYAHGKCHNVSAFLCTDSRLIVDDIRGGWHDAGDYGRYITPANQCIFNLLYAYEISPNGINEDVNIPETGSGMPDVLSEALHEIKWMLKMQSPEGGVYHKVCTKQFAGNTLPQDDFDENNPMVISQQSIQATAGFAASMSAASRAYRPFDEAFADKCLDAAKRAYAFAVANQNKIMTEFKTIAPGGGGVYGDTCAYDELYWASAELFRTTGDKSYEEKFMQFFEQKFSKTAYGAYHQGGHGSLAYCLCDNAEPEFKQKVLDIIVEAADKLLKISENDGYMVALGKDDYYWGSNAALFNGLSNMVAAAYLTKTDKYDKCMKNSCAYLFGRNIISQCYVTGFGKNPSKRPHHRPSMFDNIDEPVPGMVIGGPNDRPGQRPENSEGVPSAACYIDWEWNWTTNEVAIYWNTATLFVTSYLTDKE